MKRLASYANNLLDYHAILDLLPSLAILYFTNRLSPSPTEPLRLSAVQSAILLVLGLQRRPIEAVETELGLPVAQALALFVKAVRKLSKAVEAPRARLLGEAIPKPLPLVSKPVNGVTEVEDEEEESEVELEKENEARRGLREAVDGLDLSK